MQHNITDQWMEFSRRLNKHLEETLSIKIGRSSNLPSDYGLSDLLAEPLQIVDSWLSGHHFSHGSEDQEGGPWKKEPCPISSNQKSRTDVIRTKISEDPTWLYERCVAIEMVEAIERGDRSFFQAVGKALLEYGQTCVEARSNNRVIRNFLFSLYGPALKPQGQDGDIETVRWLLRNIASDPYNLDLILNENLLSNHKDFSKALERWTASYNSGQLTRSS
ncbi:MAG TPA: hypothetical protein PKC28_13350 [Bdellovibrionales bacterium]|nr:hypothetical protein [Bdellovibrionales bacterium]